MQVKVFSVMAGSGPHGNIVSWAPNQVIEVDDADKDAVAFYRGFVDAGIAELVEGKPPAATAPATSSDELDTEAEPDRGEGEPPRSGPGSGKAAWAAYAESQGFDVTDDMTRDDIIAALDES